MRATHAGKRNPTRARMMETPPPPQTVARSEYENHPSFPGRHVAIFPNKPFAEGIICPTVKTAVAEGYQVEDDTRGIQIPDGHQLLSIDADEFEELQNAMIGEVEERQSPGAPPGSEKEAQDRIQSAMKQSGGSIGSVEGRLAGERISMQQMVGNLAQVEAAQQAMSIEEAAPPD